jgi:hypothetical protein
LLATPGPTTQILDEYGQEISLLDLIRMIESISVGLRRRQYDWVVAHPGIAEAADGPGFHKTWLDPDGFSLYAGEFC